MRVSSTIGITLASLRRFGAIPNTSSVLDIGSSDLYGADIDSLNSFAAGFGCRLDPSFAGRIAAGSVCRAGITKNESFVGELLEQVGLRYLAFDVANGYRTQFFDLNSESLADDLRESFDTVINFDGDQHVSRDRQYYY